LFAIKVIATVLQEIHLVNFKINLDFTFTYQSCRLPVNFLSFIGYTFSFDQTDFTVQTILIIVGFITADFIINQMVIIAILDFALKFVKVIFVMAVFKIVNSYYLLKIIQSVIKALL
jgi:hypothetical protein